MKLNLLKDLSIKNVLSKLAKQFGEDRIMLSDYWNADLCAIGIRNKTDEENLIYISTHNLPNDLYFAEIEKAISKTNPTDYVVIEKFDEIDFGKLAELVTEYLFLQPIYEK